MRDATGRLNRLLAHVRPRRVPHLRVYDAQPGESEAAYNARIRDTEAALDDFDRRSPPLAIRRENADGSFADRPLVVAFDPSDLTPAP